VQAVIHDSLQLALSDRSLPLPSMRKYAQEFDDAVLMQHVDLYVNEWTISLGEIGCDALRQLSTRAQECGLVPANSIALEIFGQ
ncbi:MAG: hypothetical protein O2856_00260, partial [Planctomycetota bacterium]|nr:hypothetical protein [Planctomycetota bacterium]